MKYITIAAALLASAPALATDDHHHRPQPPRAANNSSSSASNNSSTSTSSSNSSSGASSTGGDSNVRINNTSTLENKDVLQVPGIVAPVPRGFVPVMSVYGQLDYQQRGTVGAQISIPLAR